MSDDPTTTKIEDWDVKKASEIIPLGRFQSRKDRVAIVAALRQADADATERIKRSVSALRTGRPEAGWNLAIDKVLAVILEQQGKQGDVVELDDLPKYQPQCPTCGRDVQRRIEQETSLARD